MSRKLPRYLFLDIDGVVNTYSDKDPDFMHPKHLDILNELQDELGFETVLSSSWRRYFPIEVFNKKFLGFGAKHPVVDYTPATWQLDDELYTTIYETTHVYQGWSKRGDEIQLWLDEHNLVPGQNCSICIIDDNTDMKHLMKYLVLTSMSKGLHKGHKKQIRQMFEKQEKAL